MRDQCSHKIAEAMMEGFATLKKGVPQNSIYMMAHSGARDSLLRLAVAWYARPIDST